MALGPSDAYLHRRGRFIQSLIDNSHSAEVPQRTCDQGHPDPCRDEVNSGLHKPDIFLYHSGREAGLVAGLHDLAVTAGYLVLRRQDEGFIRKGLQRHLRLACQWVLLRQSHDQGFSKERLNAKSAVLQWQVEEANVDPFTVQRLHLLIWVQFPQMKVDLREARGNSRRTDGSTPCPTEGKNPIVRRPTLP